LGRAPKKGPPEIKAKEAVPEEPDTAIIKLVSGDTLKVNQSARLLRGMLGDG